MSTSAASASQSSLRRLWLKWRFHLNVLLLAIPLLFMQQYFSMMAQFRGESGLGERMIGQIHVGPWSLALAESHDEAPESEGAAGHVKEFSAALCNACIDQVKATYIKLGEPRNLRTAGAIFEGSPYRLGAEVMVPADLTPSDKVWITMEGWDGSVHQATVALDQASPKTLAWLNSQGARP